MSHFLSPSLLSTGNSAYEVKFLVSKTQGDDILQWAATHLEKDPHGNPEQGHSYETTTLYLDTPDLKVFRSEPGHKTEKLRVRTYDGCSYAYLELKRKQGNRVNKTRTRIELSNFEFGTSMVEDEKHQWFIDRVAEAGLSPVCRVHYVRNAYSGVFSDLPVRLTLDHSISGSSERHWSISTSRHNDVCVLDDSRILEIKFQQAMPVAFKQLIRDLKLTESRVSKYRRVMSEIQTGGIKLCSTG